jgi:apolipoprotein N-acyltransferase
VSLLRIADWFRGLTGWRRSIIAIAAGVLTSLSLPPADLLPVLWISIPALVWLLEGVATRKGAFWIGWCFAWGYLAFSLYWLTFALFVAIDQYWWLVPFASNGLAAGLALFGGVATSIAHAAARDRPFRRVALLVAMLSLFEWLRGHVLTGFPWNLPGYAWTDFPWLIQIASVIGIYGVTILVLLAPALAAPLGSPFATRRFARAGACGGLAILVVAAVFGAIRLPSRPVPTVPDVRLRLVQPAILQSLKWVRDLRYEHLKRHSDLSVLPAEKPPTAIIWPESAEPFPLDNYPENAKAIAAILKPGQILITGIARDFPDAVPRTYRDSLQALNSSGEIVGTYDKFHYVPFGEYMPLQRWLPLRAVAASSVEPTEGPGPMTLRLPGLPPAAPLICYEVIFPHAVVDEKDRPDWLLDVTNDGWFGLTAGPHQHFSMMRVRAVEEGLPLVNAANDGVSGVIDPYGRITAELGLGKSGILDADLPKAIPSTVYARLGDIPFFMIVAILTVLGFFNGRLLRRA